MNLHTLITDKIAALGGPTDEKAAKYFNASKGTIAKWYGGTAFPTVIAAQKVLDEEIEAGRIVSPAFAQQPGTPAVPAEVASVPAQIPTVPSLQLTGPPVSDSPLMSLSPDELIEQLSVVSGSMDPERRVLALQHLAKDLPRQVLICLPTTGNVNPTVLLSILGLSKNLRFAGIELKKDTLIHTARNVLAERFLASKAEWSLWIDSDMIVPFGSAAIFKAHTGSSIPDQAAGVNALIRLTHNSERTIVGGVYAARVPNGPLLIQPHLDPRNESDKTLVERIRKEGPINKLAEVDWVSMGICAIHRSVFEDIKSNSPELAPKKKGRPFNFFSLVSGEEDQDVGEDVLFCQRAKAAGHQSWLDLGIHAAHVGNFAYLP